LKPLKFLGIEYNGETNKLRARTRKGSSLLYDKEALIDAVNKGEVHIGYEEKSKLTD